MKIIGHRGAKGIAPENSLLAIQKAIDMGVDSIEVDIRLHNKHLVLSHDETVKTKEYCRLDEALDLIKGNKLIVLDIKELGTVKKLLSLLKDYDGEVVFSSKKYDVLQKIRRLEPDANLAVIESWSGVRAVAQASLLNTNRIHINHNWLWSGFVRSMKHRGYDLYAFTVNTVERADELQTWGVNGIFTDFPNLFAKSKNKN